MAAQLSLDRFKKLAETHLDILQKHERKIQMLRKQGEWGSVKSEEVNAQRTMRQLISDFQQILCIQGQLDPLTRERFRKELEPLEQRIQITIEGIDSLVKAPPTEKEEPCFSDSVSENIPSSDSPVHEKELDSLRELSEVVQKDADAHAEICRDILELQGLMHDFATLVHTQHDTVDSIEQHVENAHENLHHGERDLKKSVQYKAASYPLAGGLIGAAAAAGPVGLLVGLKVAAVAAIGGGLAGALGGKFFKNKANNEEGTEAPAADTSKSD